MSLSRLAVLFLFAAASTYSFAADPNAKQVSSNLRASLESVRLVPWFTGIHHEGGQAQADDNGTIIWRSPKALPKALQGLPGTLSQSTCLKLRTYKVKRQETFNQGESASRGYSTCEWTSNYQLRSTVETIQIKPWP